MATNGGQIEFGIGFNVDKTALTNLQSQLKEILSMNVIDLKFGAESLKPIKDIEKELQEAQQAATILDNALENAFNNDLGTLNVSKFQQSLTKAGVSLSTLHRQLMGAGDVGVSTFRNIATQVLTTNTYLKQSDKIISKMAETLSNTLKWNIASSAINNLTGSIEQAWGFTKSLDTSLNNIQIVTNKSAEDMKQFALQANDAAKALKTTTTAYSDAALTFYQQGLSDEDVAARAETSVKVSNVTGLSGEQSAEYVTAVLNGYKVAAEGAEEAMDKLAAVGAATASDLAELSEAMSKVASSANAMGVSEDQLAATLATVISVTRQDAATVGTAFKTIYARISDIEAGSAEAEISLGNYTKKMAEMGFNVLDTEGNLRDLGEVMEEIGGQWENLTREQQISLAQTMAGTRQYNNLIALFDNWADYEDALNVSMEANGTLQKQQEIYAESLTAKLNELTAAKEGLYNSFIDSDSMKGAIDVLTELVKVIDNFIQGIGGGGNALLGFGSILVRVFSKQISSSITTLINNVTHLFDKLDQAAAKQKIIAEWRVSGESDTVINKLMARYDQLQDKLSNLTSEQYNATMEMLKQQTELDDIADQWEQNTLAAQEYAEKVTGINANVITEQDNQVGIGSGENREAVSQGLKTAKEKFDNDDEKINNLSELIRLEAEYKDLQAQRTEADINSYNAQTEEHVNNYIKQIEDLNNKINKNRKDIEKFNITVGNLNDTLDNLTKEETLNLIDDENAKQKIKETVDELKIAISQAGINSDNLMSNLLSVDDGTLNDLIQSVQGALEEAGGGLEDKINDIIHQLSQESIQEGEALQINAEQKDQEFTDALNSMELQAKVQSITELTSAVMGLASAFSAIKNIGSIWNNDDLTYAEQLTQTLGILASAITTTTMALSALSKTELGAKIITDLLNVSFIKDIFVKQGVITTNETLTLSILGVKASLGSLLIIVTGVIAVLGLLTFGISQISKVLNKNVEINKQAAEQAQQLADAEHEQTEALREQKDAIDAVIEGYEDLYNQYKNGQINLEELRQKTYDLCMQYEQEDLALKALIADQEELNRIMQQAQNKTNLKLYEQSKEEAGYTKDAIKRGIMADAKGREDSVGYGTSTIDLKGMAIRNDIEEEFAQALETAGINFENQDHINVDSLVEAYTNNYDELMGVLSDYSNLDAAQKIGEYLDNQQENLNQYKEAVETEEQLYIENLLQSKYDSDTGFVTGENFHTAVTDAAQSATAEKYGARTEENAEDWDAYYQNRLEAATDYYAQYTELANDARIEEINSALEASGIIIDNMNLTQAQLDYLYLHLDTADAYTHLEDFFKDYEKDIEIANNKSVLLELDAQLSDPDKEAFTDEELSSYFGLDNFEEQIGMTLNQLKGIDFQDQKIALFSATQQMKTDLLDSYTEAMKSNQESLEAISDKLNDDTIKHNSFLKNRYENFVNEIGVDPSKALKQIDEYNQGIVSYEEYESIDKLINKYGDLATAKEKITEDKGKNNYSYLEVEQELQELQAQGIELGDIETTQQLNEQQDALQENIAKSKAEMESLKQEILKINEEAAASAQSLRDLNVLKDEGAFVDIEGTTEDEGKATYNKRAEELYEAARIEDLDSEEVRDYAHYLKEASVNSEELSDDLKDNLEDSQDLAVQIKRMNKGVDTLSSNWENWSDILKNSSKESEEYADAIMNSKEAMADLLDVTEDFISDDFITEHMEDIAKAADGDAEAIDRLRAASVEDIVMHLDLDDSELTADQIMNRIQNIQNIIDINSLKVGAEIDDEAFIEACNALIRDAGLTKDQVNAMFSGMGYDVNYAEENQKTETKVPTYATEVRTEGDLSSGNYIQYSRTYQTGEQVFDGEIPTSAMITSAPGTSEIPQIKSVTKKASGSMSKSSNKSGGSKGGGGGGSAKVDTKQYKDAKTDRYYDVNIALKDINDEMERLNNNRKRLTGNDLANSYREELDLLDKQINALTQKQKLQKEETDELRNRGHQITKDGQVYDIKSLSAQGVTFDDNGNISNYNEAIVAKTNWINDLIEQYNKMSAIEQESFKKTVEAAEIEYDQFMEDMSRYETLTQDEMIETTNEIAEALNKKIELKIEKFAMTIDLKIDTREAENRLEDFEDKMEHRDKTAVGRTTTAAEKFKNYMDSETGVQSEIDRVNTIRSEIEKIQSGSHSDIYSEYDEESDIWVDNIAKAQEDLAKYTEQMMSDLEDADALMEEVNQGLLDVFDEIQESFDDQIAGYEAVADHIAHNVALIEKLYGDNSSDKLGEWYDAQYENSVGKVDMLKKEADFWQTQMENAENDDAYKKAKENWLQSMNDLNAAVEDSLDTIVTAYENSIDQVFKKLNDSLTDGQGLDFVGEEWELINQNAERYLDTINSTFEVQKLQRKYQDAINNTDSLSVQMKLNKILQEEIGYLEEKDKLTQYDIDRANMKYDIALKQIALEEAQQNKTSLRLKRDSQGNYSYQYIGDEEDIAQKQQELADAQNSLYNLDKNQYQQNLDDMYSIYSEFQDKMMEVAKTYGYQSEEYEKYKVLYTKQYGDMINGITTENEYIKNNLMQSAYDALKNMYESDSKSFAVMTELNMESFAEMTDDIVLQQLPAMVDGFNGSIQQMIEKFRGNEGFEGIMKGVWSAIKDAANEYQARVIEISNTSGQDLNNLQVQTDIVLQTLTGWVAQNETVIAEAETSKAAYDKIAEGVKNLAEQFKTTKEEAGHAATNSTNLLSSLNADIWKNLIAQQALDNLNNALREWNNTEAKVKTFVVNNVTNDSGGSGSGGSGGGLSSAGNGFSSGVEINTSAIGTARQATAKKYYIRPTQVHAKMPNGKEKWGPFNSSDQANREIQTNSNLKNNRQNYKVTTYKSGGYTGAWTNGSQEENGKLAFLHQKELVLNENDTTNFLKAIRELKTGGFRNITEAMSSQMLDVQKGSMDFQNQISRQLDRIIDSMMSMSNTLEQQVNIQAKFEDARSSQDIITALDQLTNRASQAAFNINRKW